MSNIKKVVWISSFPKSGNTFFHSVLRNAGRNLGFPQVDLDVYNLISSGKSPSACPLVKKDENNSTTVLKTHAQYKPKIHESLNLETLSFCHILRNPLDILLSYINYSRIEYADRINNEKYASTLFIDFLGFKEIQPYDNWKNIKLDDIPKRNLDYALAKYIENNTLIPSFKDLSGTWIEHSKSWLSANIAYSDSITLKYEDLISDISTFNQLQKIFNIPLDAISKAVETINHRNNQLRVDPSKPISNIFYNKMSSYYYLDYFSKSLIKDFLKKFKSQLSQFGYDDLPN